MSITKKISLVIVTYNSNKTIFRLLSSIKLINNLIKEIIVIDNNSLFINTNKIKKISKKTKIIQNKINVGFAKAVNKGIKLSKSKYVLLLNPDTYLIDKSIINTFKLINKDKKIGIIGGRILDEKKQISYTANSKPNFFTGLFEFTNLKKIFPKNKFSTSFWLEKKIKTNEPIEVSSLCGAFLIIRRKIHNHLNLLDEAYFLYLEDVDFGIKVNNEGYKVIFDPNSQIVHIGGFSSKNKYKTDLKHWYESREIFFKKHLNIFAAIILIVIFKLEKNILHIRNIIHHDSTK
jgi:GT2 family glycosyltransferase